MPPAVMEHVSKKLAVAGAYMAWLLASDLPAEYKMKYGFYLAGIYIVAVAVLDAVDKIWGKKKDAGQPQ